MPKPLIDDELWSLVEPLLPEAKPRRADHPGSKLLAHRAVLSGIIFVLKTGIKWDDLPAELGWGCGRVCWEPAATRRRRRGRSACSRAGERRNLLSESFNGG